MRKLEKICVIGAGAWGTALASVTARNGRDVTLFGRDPKIINEINSQHSNEKYLPLIELPHSIKASSDIESSLSNIDLVLLVVPAQQINAFGKTLLGKISPATPIIACAKGIDRNTGLLPAENLKTLFPDQVIGALSGPSFASDVANNLPTAVTLAGPDNAKALSMANALSGPSFRVYASDDLIGVELGGALKNIIAVAVGVCRGMKLGASAEAALIARGFSELSRFAATCGVKPETLMGLSGLGDLCLTCSGPQSRNFAYGMALGAGKDTSNLGLAEGALSAAITAKLAIEKDIDCPIIQTVTQLVNATITPQQALSNLLARPLKNESD